MSARMKAALALPLLLALAGCGPDERDITACRQDASHALSAKADAMDVDEYLKSCMVDRGYHFTAVMSGCSRGRAYQNAACYVR
jgi:hypothetical protein